MRARLLTSHTEPPQVLFQHFTEGAEFMYQDTFITVLNKFGLVRDDILPPSNALRVFKSGARSR